MSIVEDCVNELTTNIYEEYNVEECNSIVEEDDEDLELDSRERN